MSLPQIALSNPQADAIVYLNGAHLSSWRPKGVDEVLFMSKSSHFQPGKAIRGGVPIIFPWFGNRAGHPESPAHGFARTMSWNVIGCDQKAEGPCAMTLELQSNDATKAIWPFDFALRFTICASKTLSMALAVQNTGTQPFTFEEALHTYLSIGDIAKTSITGLAGANYIDKVENFSRKQQSPDPIVISGETDRVYLATKSACVVNDPVLKRKLVIAKENSDATVVWNPWITKAKAMSDFGADEWQRMVCVETCNVADHAITLAPGNIHTMTAIISVEK